MSHCKTHWLDPTGDKTSCNRAIRCAYMADIDVFDPNMFVFVDETGFDRRKFGPTTWLRLTKESLNTHQLLVYGQHISVIGVMKLEALKIFTSLRAMSMGISSSLLRRDVYLASCYPM